MFHQMCTKTGETLSTRVVQSLTFLQRCECDYFARGKCNIAKGGLQNCNVNCDLVTAASTLYLSFAIASLTTLSSLL